MSLENELFGIEKGFWLEGEQHFLDHLDNQCLLAFPQGGEMHGVYSRTDVAATVNPSNRRWRSGDDRSPPSA